MVSLTLIIALLAVASLGYPRIVRVKNLLLSGREHLRALEGMARGDLFASLKPEDLKVIKDELTQAEADLRALKAEVRPFLPLCRYLSWVPFVGKDVEAAPHLLEMAIGVPAAARLALDGLQPLADLLSVDTPDEPSAGGIGERAVSVLQAEQSKFSQALAELTKVAEARRKINKGKLSPRLARLIDRLDKYLPLLRSALRGVMIAPDLLGASEPKSYLILAQNNHELRATGGFISGVGLLRLDKGKITELDYRDSYAVDDLSKPHPPPPEPLTRYMSAGMLLLRDANWSPDFPSSAQVIESIYQLDQGVVVDGVIAVDLVALQLLVGTIEPIYVEAYDEHVDENGVLEKMKAYWASPLGKGQTGDWWAHRKDFMAALLKAMMAKLEAEAKVIEMPKLLKALQKGLEEKHILIYMHDPITAQLLAENNWDGSLRSTEGDYLMVVDTNMGYNKVNPNIEETIAYRVTINEDGTARGEVTITYLNKSAKRATECVQEAKYEPTYDQMMQGCYWDYVRVYVPEGSLLVETNGFEELTIGPAEGGKNVFATFLVIAPGECRQISFTYDLPKGVLTDGSNRKYSLYVQKQPGTSAIPLCLTFVLPPQARLTAVESNPTSMQGNIVEYQSTLLTDQRFAVTFTVANDMPRPSTPSR